MTTVENLISLAKKRFEFEGSIRANDDFFDTLGIDSFQAMELLTDIENHFDIEVPDYELQGVTTFEGLAAIIEERKS